MKSLVNILSNTFPESRLLYLFLGVALLFLVGFAVPFMVVVGKIGFVLAIFLVILDVALLYSSRNPVSGERIIETKLSNGDYNPVILRLRGEFTFKSNLEIVEEFPPQLQERDRKFHLRNQPNKFIEDITYEIRPTERGVYKYGDVLIFAATGIGLLRRKLVVKAQQEVKVYPSFIQFRKFSFLAISNRLTEAGVKKVRKLGVSNEFEQIREYVRGDDFRLVNWKATARRNDLMVNQYQEERSQNIFCVVDKGRTMHTPFEGLSLIDYAINSSLVLSGIALGRGDKAGLVTFSDKIGSFIQPKSKSGQMSLIAEALYDQETRVKEADFLRLYRNIRNRIKKRSLIVLYTNFDTVPSLHRQVKYLKAISRYHLLVTVIFDNTEITARAETKSYSMVGTTRQTIAEKFHQDKRLIIRELRKNGIHTILTEPEDLTVNSINKYIELKAMGAI